ncbi:MerR family DNA-binding transcriptional regulator [Vagococcus hydrophili]|uniref:MerR family DNA-binding transcriptional regulator n=1 Tax=Vagococcus hydrophili TaxID=2714947 RepID=A0A6G8ATZ3_9ENTE|nr:MerR family DNA-binding transcriptional regulator [Vagococcus hydrophili]QIL48551.1 MerR family DNA-binding transcriptional regulator [Vagococcus hydrophili]
MNEPTLSIGEIAKLFDIPASTIRYWEDKEIFASRRNDDNDYRTFNMQSMIELLDVIFYRNLNVPIHKMKHFNKHSPETIYRILQDTGEEVEQELKTLQHKLAGIKHRKEQLEELFALKNRGYQVETFEIEKIVSVDMSNKEDIQVQLEFLSNFVLYRAEGVDEKTQMGISVPKDYDRQKEILWEKPSSNRKYITCLIECDAEDLEKNNLEEHIQKVSKQGYQVKQVISTYLATASDEYDIAVDYYKGWIEVE